VIMKIGAENWYLSCVFVSF